MIQHPQYGTSMPSGGVHPNAFGGIWPKADGQLAAPLPPFPYISGLSPHVLFEGPIGSGTTKRYCPGGGSIERRRIPRIIIFMRHVSPRSCELPLAGDSQVARAPCPPVVAGSFRSGARAFGICDRFISFFINPANMSFIKLGAEFGRGAQPRTSRGPGGVSSPHCSQNIAASFF